MPLPTIVSRADTPVLSQCFPPGLSPLDARLSFVTELFGNNTAWLLLGFVFAQTYTFYRYSAKGPLSLKILGNQPLLCLILLTSFPLSL